MMLKEKLDEIIRNHMHWLREDCDGWENMRANLTGTYLIGANLSESDHHVGIIIRKNSSSYNEK